MKDFAMRHAFALGFVIYGVFLTLAVVISRIYHHSWFFPLFILAFLGLFGGIIFNQRWVCVCPSCGEKNLIKTQRRCPKCGEPTLIRKRLRKICPDGHKIDDESDYYQKCPQCGKPLQPIETNYQPIETN